MRSGVEPVAHGRLIPVVDLHVLQSGDLPGDHIEVIENLLCAVTRGPKQYQEHHPVGGAGNSVAHDSRFMWAARFASKTS